MARALAAALLLALFATGCRDTADSTSTGGTTVSVYSLLPLQGPSAPVSRDVVDGEKLALRDARGQVGDLTVNFRSVDSSEKGAVTRGSAAAAARRAAQDPSAIGAIGALSAGEAEVEIPLLNEASVGLVTPAVSDLSVAEPRLYPTGQQTLARVIGDDRGQARAIARTAKRLHCGAPRIVTGPSRGERLLPAAVRGATSGLSGRRCTVLATDHIALAARAARQAAPQPVIAPFALAVPAFTRALGGPAERAVHLITAVPQAGAGVGGAFGRTFGRPASIHALLGYDAMKAVLSAVGRSGARGNDRAVVARALTQRRVDRWSEGIVRGGEIRLARQ